MLDTLKDVQATQMDRQIGLLNFYYLQQCNDYRRLFKVVITKNVTSDKLLTVKPVVTFDLRRLEMF